MTNRLTDCNQRLEFLGDAVLGTDNSDFTGGFFENEDLFYAIF
jgi:hypothetical protein